MNRGTRSRRNEWVAVIAASGFTARGPSDSRRTCQEAGLVLAIAAAKEGDLQARDAILAACWPIVLKEGARFSRSASRQNLVDDATQEAGKTLLDAIDTYDVTLGTSFVGYATKLIRHRIVRVVSQTDVIRVPRYVRTRQTWAKRAHSELEQRLGREPTRAEMEAFLASENGMGPDEIASSLALVPMSTSLDAVIEAAIAFEPVDSDCEVALLAASQDCVDAAKGALASMSSRDREIVLRHIGLDGDPMHRAELAREYDLHRNALDRILSKGMALLSTRGAIPDTAEDQWAVWLSDAESRAEEAVSPTR